MAAPKVHLTKKQRALIDFIEQYTAENGEAPTLQEIASRFRITKVTVFQHLRALEKKKVLKRSPYAVRGTHVQVEYVTHSRLPRLDLPVVGAISDGAPLDVFSSPKAFDLASLVETRKDCTLLRAKGDSMKGDHILDGDYVIVERREWAKDGEVVVALLPGGEASLRRLHREEDGVHLESANPEVPPITVPEAKVYGVVVGIVRRGVR